MNDVDVLVVGGGISGLALSWLLAHKGVRVEIWERETRPGGKIQSRRENGYLTEQSASMVMNFRPDVNQFLAACGLEAGKLTRKPLANRYVVDDGRLVATPMKLSAMLTTPLWSLRGKLRLALEPFILKGGHNEETVSQFITRRLGREILEKAMGPYVAGPLASDPDLACAYSTLPRLTALERRYGSLTLGVFVNKVLRRRTATEMEVFSFHNGMASLVKSLAADPAVHFRARRRVTGLERSEGGWQVTGRASETEHMIKARHVVLSVPAYTAANLLSPVDDELGKLLSGIDYTPLSVVHLGLSRTAIRHPLDGNGFLAPYKESPAPSGSLWMSSLFPDRSPQDKVLLSNYLGGARLPQASSWSEERSVATVIKALRPLLGIEGDPEMVRIDRHPRGLPLYHGAYHARMQGIERRLEQLSGLDLVANYRGGVSVRDRIACAQTTASRILAMIGHKAPAKAVPQTNIGLDPIEAGKPVPADSRG